MKRVFYFVFTLWLLLWAQVISDHFLGGTLFAVQWLLLAVIHFGLMQGSWTGIWMGFTWGLLMDASSLGLLGIHAILFSAAGYAAGILRRQLDASKLWTQSIFSWMVSVVYIGCYLVVGRFFSIPEKPFQWVFITVPLINAIVAPFIFRMLDEWSEAWDVKALEV